MLMEMAGSRSCEGRAFQDNGLDEENAREPNVDVVVRGMSLIQRLKSKVRHYRRLTATSAVYSERCSTPGVRNT